MVIAWTGVIVHTNSGLPHTRTHTRTHTHTQTDAGNDTTRRPKLASGKNCRIGQTLEEHDPISKILHHSQVSRRRVDPCSLRKTCRLWGEIAPTCFYICTIGLETWVIVRSIATRAWPVYLRVLSMNKKLSNTNVRYKKNVVCHLLIGFCTWTWGISLINMTVGLYNLSRTVTQSMALL